MNTDRQRVRGRNLEVSEGNSPGNRRRPSGVESAKGKRSTTVNRADGNKGQIISPEARDAQRRARREAYLRRKKRRRIQTMIGILAALIVAGIITALVLVFLMKSPVELGTEQLNNKKYTDAITEFTKGLDDINYIGECHKGIGIAYYELGQYKDAIDNLELAIQKGETALGTTYYILAISYMEVEDYENALKHITSALTKTGNSNEMTQELRFNEVVCMEFTGDWTGAKAKATSYMQSYPDDMVMEEELLFLESR